MPWNAEVGNAWWLLCHDSPNEIRLSSQTLRLSSDELEVPPAPEVADRVDRERDVVEQEDADRAAPQQRRQRALPGADDRVADRGRHEQRDDEPDAEELVDRLHAALGEQVGHVLRDLGAALGDEQPADVRMEEVLRRGEEAVAAADVRAVRIAFLIRELMVLAMVGDPREHRAFDGHRAEDRERPAHPLLRLERAMREEPVVADRDADARQQVADGEQHEVDPVQPRVPEQRDRDDQARRTAASRRGGSRPCAPGSQAAR